mmetsp:Transcript_11597/g.31448  ORF Transcript_11597/g.31448 Transcript_11597/m.31448 type:complete len:210 (-) Transcript_11597:39-668(-)
MQGSGRSMLLRAGVDEHHVLVALELRHLRNLEVLRLEVHHFEPHRRRSRARWARKVHRVGLVRTRGIRVSGRRLRRAPDDAGGWVQLDACRELCRLAVKAASTADEQCSGHAGPHLTVLSSSQDDILGAVLEQALLLHTDVAKLPGVHRRREAAARRAAEDGHLHHLQGVRPGCRPGTAIGAARRVHCERPSATRRFGACAAVSAHGLL